MGGGGKDVTILGEGWKTLRAAISERWNFKNTNFVSDVF